jgi:RNA polymerase sigma-70 factor (ECF subfamily)
MTSCVSAPRRLPTVSMDESINEDEEGEGATRDIPDSSLLPEEKALNKEVTEVIRQAMLRLPEQFRTAIVLREVEGLSYEEIAVITQTENGHCEVPHRPVRGLNCKNF